MTKAKKIIFIIVLLLLLLPVLVFNGWCGWQIHLLSLQRAQMRTDYSEVNNIKYGLLSVEVWKNQLQYIISEQIETFDLSKDQEKALRDEITDVLNALITQADSMLQSDHKTIT